METSDAPAPAPGPAPARPFELEALAPFVVLLGCLAARHFGVAQSEVDPIELVCCLLINPKAAGRT